MELIRSLTQLREYHRGCVASIGNFDGVHKGHQVIFDKLKEKAHALDVPVVIISFEPQPLEFFQGAKAPARLTRLREKKLAMDNLGIKRLLCLRFNKHLVNMPANEFIRRILIDGLAIKSLIVGDDFRFGYQRQGDFHTLQEAGRQFDFDVSDTPTVLYDGERISSTRIRSALQQGELDLAENLLGRRYALSGRIAHGFKRGRTIGFPTANVHLHRQASPVSGVFAVYMHGLEEKPLPGVANLGFRPTLDGTFPLLEVHLFDFSDDIYGRYVEVEFIKKLRAEQKFDSFDALKAQIHRDAETARQLLGC
jgi:riboflavin kinase/FMN adenylyltransferase